MPDDDPLGLIDEAQRAAHSLVARDGPWLPNQILAVVVPLASGAVGAGVLPSSTVGVALTAVAGGMLALLGQVAWAEPPNLFLRPGAQDLVGHREPRSGRRPLPAGLFLTAVALPWLLGAASEQLWAGALLIPGVTLAAWVRQRRWHAAYRRPRRSSARRRNARPSWAMEDPDTLRLVAALAVVGLARPSAIATALGMAAQQLDTVIVALEQAGYVAAHGNDGIGTRYHLTYRGRSTFRDQLAHFEYP